MVVVEEEEEEEEEGEMSLPKFLCYIQSEIEGLF